MMTKANEIAIEDLNAIKYTLPVKCSLVNLQLLRHKFEEFKACIAQLPLTTGILQHTFESNFNLINECIESVEKNIDSVKMSTNSFQEAVNHIKAQIEAITKFIQAETV